MIDTELLYLDGTDDDRAIRRAGELLAAGKRVVIPTETVYGLAANALDSAAVAGIFTAKGRPQDNPLIVHISDMAMLPPLVAHVPPQARQLADAFWPGPLTIILPKSDAVPRATSGGLDTVAVRMPAHPAARAVIEAAGLPLAAPSANRSGSPSPTTAQHCIDDMSGRVEAILCGGDCDVGVESTVMTLCTPTPRLLRPGAVTAQQLQAVLGALGIDPGVEQRLDDDAPVSSPGMKYKHYAPQAKVILLRGDADAFANYVRQHLRVGDCVLCFDQEREALAGCGATVLCYGERQDHAAQARQLFGLLRRLDALHVATAYVHAPDTDGVGLAVYNRLIRAAGFCVIDLPVTAE